MTTHKEALTLALEMVQNKMYAHAEMYLKEALAQEQEPVAHTAVFHCPNCEYLHRQVTHITGVAQPPWLPQRKEQEPMAVYGYCPECGAKGVARERRPDGNDCCANGHTYPSRTANKTSQRTWVGLTDDEREAAMAGMDNRWDIAEAIEDELKEKNT